VRIGDRGVVDQHVEPAELASDARRRGGDRRAIGDVELDRAGVAGDRPGRFLPRARLREPTSTVTPRAASCLATSRPIP